MLEFSWTHEGKDKFDITTDDMRKKFDKMTKKQKNKCYNFAVFAVALTNLPQISSDNLGAYKINEEGIKLMGFSGNTQLWVFMGLMLLTILAEPLTKLVMMYIAKYSKKIEGEVDARTFGITNLSTKMDASLLKDILIFVGCLLLILAPLFLL